MKRPDYAIWHSPEGFLIVDEAGECIEPTTVHSTWEAAQARILEMVREDDEAERESAA